jgi:hypothetical protein
VTLPALAGDDEFRSLTDYEPVDAAAARSAQGRAHLRLVRGPEPVPPPIRPAVPPAVVGVVLRQVLEVLDGRRSIHQLQVLVPEPTAKYLAKRVVPGGQHVLRSLHACFPTPSAVEVAATVHYRAPSGRRRVFAAAARFERTGNRWSCRVLRML